MQGFLARSAERQEIALILFDKDLIAAPEQCVEARIVQQPIYGRSVKLATSNQPDLRVVEACVDAAARG